LHGPAGGPPQSDVADDEGEIQPVDVVLRGGPAGFPAGQVVQLADATMEGDKEL